MTAAAVTEVSGRLLTLMREPVVPAVGVHPKVRPEVYHGWDAASNSRLGRLKRSPAHLKAYLDGEVEDDTPAKDLGRAFHCAVLEPDAFTSRYVVAEQCEQITKEKKRCSKMASYYSGSLGWLCGTHGSQKDQQPGVEIIGAKDHARILKMRDSVFAHRAARVLLQSGEHKELSLVWNDEETGVLCKARLDNISTKVAGGAVIDLKKTRDASRGAFERSILTYGYHRQGSLYLQGTKVSSLGNPEHFVNIAVEDEPPFAVGVYRMNEGALDAGAGEVLRLLKVYAECREKNEWPAYSDEVEDSTLPDYAWAQLEQEENEHRSN